MGTYDPIILMLSRRNYVGFCLEAVAALCNLTSQLAETGLL